MNEPALDIWSAEADGPQEFAQAMEEASRRVLLALGICPEHDLEMRIVDGHWECTECMLARELTR